MALAILAASSGNAEAHRVNIFAYLDGAYVQVDCSFNRSQKVRQGAVTVFDAATNAPLAGGFTDDAGMFRFPVPANTGEFTPEHGLRIHIDAGEGHQNEWFIDADTLKTAVRPETSDTISTSNLNASPADLESIINNALDRKLAPLKQMIAAQYNSGPAMSEIIGGIGWIFGLVGIAAYFKRRS